MMNSGVRTPVAGGSGNAVKGAGAAQKQPAGGTAAPNAADQGRLRKVEALTKQLFDECFLISKASQDQAFESIASTFKQRVPNAAKLWLQASAVAKPTAVPAAGNPGGGVAPVVEAKKLQGVTPTEEVSVDSERFLEAMEQLLQDATGSAPSQWNTVWGGFGVPREEECDAVTALLQVATRGPDMERAELAARIITELARTYKVQLNNIERALQGLAAHLEDLSAVNESAWNVYSHLLVQFFPKTPSTNWGWQSANWNWHSWWAMAQRVLTKVDNFRAFDIVILALQMMQERSGQKICQLQAWSEFGRRDKMRKVLSAWGEMEESAVIEICVAYGVDI